MSVEVIPANKHLIVKRNLCKRVAAYCRVSTDQEIQLHSLETQREYYENLIKAKTGWQFVGIYADTASGLNNKKMLGFQDLMDDCRNGKIDLILIKSISRLGRNTQVEYCAEGERIYRDRPIDIDILLFGDNKIDCAELTVPHKLMYERDFVMIPLNEIKYKQ